MLSVACLLTLLLFARSAQAAEGALDATNLRTESQQAPLGVDTPHPRLNWTLISNIRKDAMQHAYRIQLFALHSDGSVKSTLVWDSGTVISAAYWNVEYRGPKLAPHTRFAWRVKIVDDAGRSGRWSEYAKFVTGLQNQRNWHAHWIAAHPDRSILQPGLEHGWPTEKQTVVLPIFRKEFQIHRPASSAFLFVSGLGQYELRINGKPVTNNVLTPGWTDYAKRVFYNTYDVTGLLKKGTNVIGVLLGNGMYNVENLEGRYTKFTGSFGQPKLIVQLHLRDATGKEHVIGSDRTWTTHDGPITYSSIYGGEDYDATRELKGWDEFGFTPRDWESATEVGGPGGKLEAEQSTPIIVANTLPALPLSKLSESDAVYDVGQNLSGWPRIMVHGSRGSSVTIKVGELLNTDGTVDQASMSEDTNVPNLFRYTLRGDENPEEWTPRFSYHGFRYLQVTLNPSRQDGALPFVNSISADWVHAGVSTTGSFKASLPILNSIHKLIDAAIVSNTMSVLTDCPHREKLGWLEQTYLNASSILYNYDAMQLYSKIIKDVEESQLSNGMIPTIAPEYVHFVDQNGVSNNFRDSPEWGSAIVLSSWELYKFTGDERILRDAYPSMQRYVQYLQSRTEGGLLKYGLGDWFDIGPGSPGESQLTSKWVTASAILYEDLSTLQKIAAILGKPDDVQRWNTEAKALRLAFNAKLFDPLTGMYDRGSQTAQAMPLVLGMVPDGQESRVLDHLIADIRGHENHVTAGDIGFHYVVRALTEFGRGDVLGDMLQRTDSPSYGFQLAKGATALTEAWDTNPKKSQNHFMLGHAEEWFYRGLAGIQFDLSKSDVITFAPQMISGVDKTSASFKSVLGDIATSWSRTALGTDLTFTVPDGQTASLLLPATQKSVWVDGQPYRTMTVITGAQHGSPKVKIKLAAGVHFVSLRDPSSAR
jgi:alpha-L-rhamnosidase